MGKRWSGSRRAGAVVLGVVLASSGSARGAGERPDDTQVEVVRQDPPVPSGTRTFPRRWMLRGSAGGLVPLVGPMAELGNLGAGAGLAFGFYFLPRVGAVVELGVGQIPEPGDDERARTLASGWLGIRGTVVPDEALTLFAELGGGGVLTTRRAYATPHLEGAELAPAVGAAAGIELDLLQGLSAEGGTRIEVLFAQRTWGGTSVIAAPYVSLALHL